jgi:hypothetical protein
MDKSAIPWSPPSPATRFDVLVATCEKGAYIGKMSAGLVGEQYAKLVPWTDVKNHPLVKAFMEHQRAV